MVDAHVNNHEILGIVCLKDIFEEILNKELKDDDIHKSLPMVYFSIEIFIDFINKIATTNKKSYNESRRKCGFE